MTGSGGGLPHITKVRLLSASDLKLVAPEIKLNNISNKILADFSHLPRQKIYFGSPGSGKSYRVKQDTEGMNVHRTAFHPDADYASFVGAYKPALVRTEQGNMLMYKFVPQAFAEAYLDAWQDLNVPVCLIIDEINRGNCAQIFGDLFQSLDRHADNFSEYSIKADADFAQYLADELKETSPYKKHLSLKELKLPPNLFIYATMNTSDQSLFPMDSAFKRRWDWEYVPIDHTDASQFIIELSPDFRYSWEAFIRAVNQRIVALTYSEDKQLGNRFVNPFDKVISLNTFKAKVLFYLWSEIYKNEPETQNNIFVYQPENTNDVELFSFSKLYESYPDGTALDLVILPSFMNQLGLTPLVP